uniref:Uncharacterized protein n=1 Tax=mine drainage metagenome TaxID=410659 RepID=E6Q6R8_9ZZZZ
MLQWGRDVIVAEIVPRHDVFAQRGSFNGAATLSSRKLAPEADADMPTIPLQWGRDVIVAEIVGGAPRGAHARCFNGAATLSSRKFAPRRTQPYLEEASMGPRRYRRGNRPMKV